MNDGMAQKQEDISFTEFYKNYKKDFFYYTNSVIGISECEVEDVIGEAFLLLFESWEHIENKTPLALTVWMRKTVRYLIYNQNRRNQKLSTVSMEEIRDIQTQFSDMEQETYEELLTRIQSNLASDEYRLFVQIVVLRKSFPKIAKEMNVTTDALYVRWFRLRKKIQGFL